MVSAVAAQREVQTLYAEAREHKRLSTHHRNLAREKMQRLSELAARYRAMGIEVKYIPTEGGGDSSHGRHDRSP